MFNPFDRISARHRTPASEIYIAREEQRKVHNDELLDLAQTFAQKLAHTDYPFPLSGDDLVLTFEGEAYNAWFVGADYSCKMIVYSLHNGAIVMHRNADDKTVQYLYHTDANDNLIKEVVKHLKKYTETADESFVSIERSRWGRRLKDQWPSPEAH